MFKKITLTLLFAGFVGLLVWGGVNRTLDQSTKTAEAGGNGRSTEQTGRQINGAGNAATGFEQSAEGLAEVESWVTLDGAVTAIDETGLTLAMPDGQLYLVEGRPWRFALEQGFQAEVGDQVRLTGFYEESEFEVGQMENLDASQVMAIRNETGRPMWAGGGRAK